ncbi:hypothetical protein PIB30_100531, partial [Stylosanthes scabra]|nr:hypothetical protein [Stylosanthes scabra]
MGEGGMRPLSSRDGPLVSYWTRSGWPYNRSNELIGHRFFRYRFKLWKTCEALLLSDVLEDFSKLSKLYESWWARNRNWDEFPIGFSLRLCLFE